MKAMSRFILFLLTLSGAALAEETPSPALLVVNKGHRVSTNSSELAIVDPGSGSDVARAESCEYTVVTRPHFE
jgi:hypothetical protein